MIRFPNCKINLGLHVIRKRTDGFHDLETVFYPLPIRDVLEIITDPVPQNTEPVKFSSSGLIIEGKTENNLCIKAYHLLKKDFPQIPAIQMHLHKNIPMGAGLGGGSSDAAFTLILLNEKYQLGLTQEQLIQYALSLGSDCPFFIINKPCFAKGRGEILTSLDLDLSNYQFLIVNPGIHIGTAWAFSQITPTLALYPLEDTILLPIGQWNGLLQNDFEKPVVQFFPEIGQIIQELYAHGAIYAALSGSGSTVFGIFPKGAIRLPIFPNHYNIKQFD